MSPLRFFVTGRLSSRQAVGWARTRNLADDVVGFGFSNWSPMGDKLHGSVAAVGTLSAALGGGMRWYSNEAAEKPPPAACKLTDEEDATTEAAMKARFEEWMIKYGRRYKDEEEKARRFQIFKHSVQFVNEANARRGANARDRATFGINKFSDLTHEEVRRGRCGERHWWAFQTP